MLLARRAQAGARPTRPVTEERREELLGRLEDLVLAEGFAGLTVDDMTSRLQCSKSTLYAVASSKEQLVTAAVKHFFRDAAAGIEKRVASIDDPSKRIAKYLASVGDAMRRMSPTCYADMVSFPVTRDIYDVNSRAAATRVRQMIQEGISRGVFRQLHAEFIGETVSLLIEAIQDGALLERTKLSSGDAYAEISSLVLAALTNGRPMKTPKRRPPAAR